MLPLINYIKDNKIKTPVKLEIKLEKFVPDRNRNGRDSRYLRVFINGRDVSQMVANMTNHKISRARDTYGTVIMHGCGMDIGWLLQSEVYEKACDTGYKKMFDAGDYKLL